MHLILRFNWSKINLSCTAIHLCWAVVLSGTLPSFDSRRAGFVFV